MPRRLFTTLALFSSLLCLSLLAGWVWSYADPTSTFIPKGGGKYAAVELYRGSAYVAWEGVGIGDEEQVPYLYFFDLGLTPFNPSRGFHAERWKPVRRMEVASNRVWIFALWLPVLFSLVLPGLWASGWVKGKKRGWGFEVGVVEEAHK